MADTPTDTTPEEAPVVVETPEVPAPQEEKPEEPIEPKEPTAPEAVKSEDEEPPTRKTDWRAEFFKSKNKPASAKQPEAPAAEPTDDAPREQLREVIREEFEPLARSMKEQSDEAELKAVIEKYPEAKQLEKTIRKYMASPAYAQVSVDFIARGLLADAAAKAAKKVLADAEALKTRQGGHGRRPTEAKPKSAWDMTEDEFNKSVSDLMSGKN